MAKRPEPRNHFRERASRRTRRLKVQPASASIVDDSRVDQEEAASRWLARKLDLTRRAGSEEKEPRAQEEPVASAENLTPTQRNGGGRAVDARHHPDRGKQFGRGRNHGPRRQGRQDAGRGRADRIDRPGPRPRRRRRAARPHHRDLRARSRAARRPDFEP